MSLAKSLQEFAAVLQNLEDERTRMVSDQWILRNVTFAEWEREVCFAYKTHKIISLKSASQLISEDIDFWNLVDLLLLQSEAKISASND